MLKMFAGLTVVVVMLLSATAAGALTYQVRLHNGNVFQTRYEPVDASFDDSQLMFLSDRGNWVAISKADVAEVISETEALGRGTILDGVTILIGQLPNDKPSPEESAELRAEAAAEQIGNYTMPMFSEPNSSGGMPLNFLGMTTPPLSNSASGSSFANERRSGGGSLMTEPFSR